MYAHVALSMYAHMWLLPLYLSIPLYIPQDAPPLSVFYCRPLCFLIKNEFFALGRFAFVLFFRTLDAGGTPPFAAPQKPARAPGSLCLGLAQHIQLGMLGDPT